MLQTIQGVLCDAAQGPYLPGREGGGEEEEEEEERGPRLLLCLGLGCLGLRI